MTEINFGKYGSTTKNGGFGPRFKKRGPKIPNAPFFKNGA